MATLASEPKPVRDQIHKVVLEDLRDAYQSDQRSWVLGFSGGKDSTALLQMVYYMLGKLPPAARKKHVYVLASDTRVETPQISERVRRELELVEAAAQRDGLPISTQLVFPKLNDTFWVNLIGRGYPSPNTKFRWCTDRLKIHPVSDYIRRIISKAGQVVVVLGARRSESATRAQTMNRHSIDGQRFRPHMDLVRAWVYTPIEDLTADEVWVYLLQIPNPWNGANKELLGLYRQASGGECPLVIDTSTPSCGQSRFGCWTCTVVDRDKSMESLIDNGEGHLIPLLELRDHIWQLRNKPGARYDRRRNGSVPLRRGTEETMTNTGPFTHQTRIDILRRLLEAQRESGETLIEGDELTIIQEIWSMEETDHPEKPELPRDAVARIWKSVYEESTMPYEDSTYDHLEEEDAILREVCLKNQVPFEMLRRLRDIEEEFGHLRRRHGLPEAMRETVEHYTQGRE